jgi:gamma-glutamylcyclotransferase (GGCT)/AIG2-like uncharacterized protein YtfP
MTDFLFAYGTLQAAHAPRDIVPLLERMRYVGEGFIQGVLYDLGDYPGAVLDASPEQKVFGKVFELLDGEKTLSELDKYEEFDPCAISESLFVRELQPVVMESGAILQSWIYLYNRDPGAAPVLMQGRYKE